MSREWKPGDVGVTGAMHGGETAVRFLVTSAGFSYGDGKFVSVPPRYDAHPLVVIDPESAYDIGRLLDAVAKHGVTRAALRSLVTPPKPEEPTGLGAVVEDAKGATWIRRHPAGQAWVNGYQRWAAWSDIAAVKVLSEGVTP